jgi:hypothetical protein
LEYEKWSMGECVGGGMRRSRVGVGGGEAAVGGEGVGVTVVADTATATFRTVAACFRA